MAGLGVKVVRAESERFAAPLLLIHGLWAGNWVWERIAGYLGHRGWESWAIDLSGQAGGPRPAQLRDLLAQCVDVARTMGASPVVVGHDAGAMVALHLTARVEVQALVLMAPLLPGYGALRAALGAGRALAVLLGRPLKPPAGPSALAFFAGTEARTREILRARLIAEPGRVVYALLRGSFDPPGRLPPVLVLGGVDDAVAPSDVVRAVARAVDGDALIVPGGHWLPVEERWKETANRVHRWLVKTLGDPLLLLREESEEEP